MLHFLQAAENGEELVGMRVAMLAQHSHQALGRSRSRLAQRRKAHRPINVVTEHSLAHSELSAVQAFDGLTQVGNAKCAVAAQVRHDGFFELACQCHHLLSSLLTLLVVLPARLCLLDVPSLAALRATDNDASRTALRDIYSRSNDKEIKEAALQGMLIAGDDQGVLALYKGATSIEEKRTLLRTLTMMDSDAALKAIDSALEDKQ